MIDLGSSQKINRVKLVWEKSYAKSYSLQVSDDEMNLDGYLPDEGREGRYGGRYQSQWTRPLHSAQRNGPGHPLRIFTLRVRSIWAISAGGLVPFAPMKAMPLIRNRGFMLGYKLTAHIHMHSADYTPLKRCSGFAGQTCQRRPGKDRRVLFHAPTRIRLRA